MTFRPQSWASQPHIPVEDYQELGIRNEGKEGNKYQTKGCTEEHHAIQQKSDSRFQLPNKPECINIALGWTSQPPQSTQS